MRRKKNTTMENNRKICNLDAGMEIWSLEVSGIKEQDINAQVMDGRRMKILTSNIKTRGALESLPYVHKKGETFSVISGHHRLRAANEAGLKTIFCLVDTNEMTKSQITSKQIAHNELVGTADSEIIGQLVKQMNDVDDIIASGLPEKYLNGISVPTPTIMLPQLVFDWRIVQLAFLPEQMRNFETLVKTIDNKTQMVGVANSDQYKRFSDAMMKLGKTKNIKSVAATIEFLTELALKEIEKWQESQNTEKNTTCRG